MSDSFLAPAFWPRDAVVCRRGLWGHTMIGFVVRAFGAHATLSLLQPWPFGAARSFICLRGLRGHVTLSIVLLWPLGTTRLFHFFPSTFVSEAFWGRVTILFVAAAFPGHASILFTVAASRLRSFQSSWPFFGPCDDSIVGAALTAVFGPRVTFVCRRSLQGPRKASALWAPSSGPPDVLFCCCSLLGLRVTFVCCRGLFQATPRFHVVGAAFRGRAMFCFVSAAFGAARPFQLSRLFWAVQ